MAERDRTVAAHRPPGRRTPGAHEVAIGALPAEDGQRRRGDVDPAGAQVSLERGAGEPCRPGHEQCCGRLRLVRKAHDVGGGARLRRIAEGLDPCGKAGKDECVVDPVLGQPSHTQAHTGDDAERAFAAEQEPEQVRACRSRWTATKLERALRCRDNERLHHVVAAAVAGR